MSKIDKIKRLATDPAATNGERAGAVEALKRLGVILGLIVINKTPALNEVMLVPLAMVTPTEACIYAPSRITKPVTIPRDHLPIVSKTMLVSFEPDGKSDPQMTNVYGLNMGYWMVLGSLGEGYSESVDMGEIRIHLP